MEEKKNKRHLWPHWEPSEVAEDDGSWLVPLIVGIVVGGTILCLISFA